MSNVAIPPRIPASVAFSAVETQKMKVGDTITVGGDFSCDGDVVCLGSVTAGTGFVATTGGLTAAAGNIVATLGNITATAGTVNSGAGGVIGSVASSSTSIGNAATTVVRIGGTGASTLGFFGASPIQKRTGVNNLALLLDYLEDIGLISQT
jgi:hypothetical protein